MVFEKMQKGVPNNRYTFLQNGLKAYSTTYKQSN